MIWSRFSYEMRDNLGKVLACGSTTLAELEAVAECLAAENPHLNVNVWVRNSDPDLPPAERRMVYIGAVHA